MRTTVALHHVTDYHYDRLTTLGMQTVRLRPAPHTRSHILSYALQISPDPHFLNWQQDPFGNFLAQIVFPERVRSFRIAVDLHSEIRVFNPFDFFLLDYAKDFPFSYPPDLREELSPYLEIKERGAGLMAWLAEIDTHKTGTIDFLVAANRKVMQGLKYVIRLEPGVQSAEETLRRGSGSCRDMAWFLCQGLRHLGLATRFASGYLIQLAADVKSLDGPSGTEVDFTDLHAWTEVYLPGAGWVGLDPTSGLFAGEGHIPLCCTPNPSSAAPVSGTLEAGVNASLQHDMTVTRIKEAPRVTKPYTDEVWQAIDDFGEKVDAALKAQNIRLTMGGEPTFVSLDDRQGDAWQYDALGGNKKPLAKAMLFRLKQRLAPGGLPMFVQGKWYPGEILPRWAMPCFSRRDGEAIWHNTDLLADPDLPLGHTIATAENFLKALAKQLGIPAHYIRDAREDAPYYLWKEHRLPLADEIMAADLYVAAERKKLQALMERDLGAPTGFVLPLHFSPSRESWVSNDWQFRSPHLVLLTGDSPLGLRLPLSALPWPEAAEAEVWPERSPFEQLPPLPASATLVQAAAAPRKIGDAAFKTDANGLIRTALCAEVRDGVLHLFLPPVAWAEHFLELIARIEAVAAALHTPLVLEGYTPPPDPRLQQFSVTPDPGVIEINVPPSEDWPGLKAMTETVYQEARLARLSVEKFMLDGRRVGTGGGNHIVLGAAKPEDSPFLRRPDLLRSLLTFWQNHPALSYVFSGQYIGPTSQAPRIDEARDDSLHELEIAFRQITPDSETPPWIVDRLFRNLLVDLTGNTHRAEFCIDKLYSPDSDRGRLGLLEMRGFEMSPHPRMNLVQALLIRACVASFWKTPLPGKLIRWGTQLHDKFMLPHYLQADFHDVLETLKNRGYSMEATWFAPFFAFRFPECGRVQIGDITLILTYALEPWPVMGEEQIRGGTSRAVDATVERLQVCVKGITPGRHIVTCNGRRLPLSATADPDLHIAGVRFKAWSQPSSLHPLVPVHAPLIFDVVDGAQNRALGGCTYHVAHPGGRNYDSFPVNENEAEGRILARFEAIGHTPGTVFVPPEAPDPEFPYTLDLRRAP